MNYYRKGCTFGLQIFTYSGSHILSDGPVPQVDGTLLKLGHKKDEQFLFNLLATYRSYNGIIYKNDWLMQNLVM